MSTPIIKTDFLQEIYRDIKSYLEQREFQLFDFIVKNRDGKETYISQILAFLLDPNAPHFLGTLPLSYFLEILELQDKFEIDNQEKDKISIKTERMLKSSKRKHDILIRSSSDWVISIENKLWGANDGYNQIEDYIQDIKSINADNFFMVYLPIYEDQEPTEGSISREEWEQYCTNRQAKSLSASDIINWIDKILQSEIAQDVGGKLRIKFFLADFKAYIKETIMGETNNQDVIENIIRSMDNDKEKWDTFFLIKNNLGEIINKKRDERDEEFIKEGYPIGKHIPEKREYKINTFTYEHYVRLEMPHLKKLFPNAHANFVVERERKNDWWYYGIHLGEFYENYNQEVRNKYKEEHKKLYNQFKNEPELSKGGKISGDKTTSLWFFWYWSQEIKNTVLTSEFVPTVIKYYNKVDSIIEEYIKEYHPELI